MNERSDYYVYVLIDIDFNVRYVGEGCGVRCRHVSGRKEDYKKLVAAGAETLVLYDSLTKCEAREIEQLLIDRFITSGLLLNKRLDNKNVVNDLPYSVANEIFEISGESPSGLVWKKKISKVTVVNKQAGSLDEFGYWRVQLRGIRYRVHRIVWVLYKKQDIPSNLVINHIDSNPSNNKLSNLESVTQKINSLKKIKPRAAAKFAEVPTGISKLPQDNKELYRFRATVVDPDGKVLSKSFSSKKYGEEVALSKAIAWRENLLLMFYGQA